MNRALVLVALACLAATSAEARLGETLEKLKERYGKPQTQLKKESATWFFDTDDEKQLVFTATFNDKGLVIAEGLKPVRYARLTRESVQAFIDLQVQPFAGSKTLRSMKPGEQYTFAGKAYTCAATELVIVDDANGILIVWNNGADPFVLAVTPQMLH
ncbi:MAG: hypothetical protein HYV95_14690 [Opitutae bacterium]|nr:hypothetical protein [Opitutae bacterium]